MNRSSVILVVFWVLLLLVCASGVYAHILKLKDGRILKGTLVGATGDMISFRVEGDTLRTFPLDDVISLHISSASLDAAPLRPAEPVKISAGTIVRVALASELGTVASGAGDRFFAELAENLVVGDVTVSAAGKRVFGQVQKVVKPVRGNDRAAIEIQLTGLTVGGKTQPVVTDYFGVQNDGKGNWSLLGTARPVDAALTHFMRERNVLLPKGTKLEFRITEPVTLRDFRP